MNKLVTQISSPYQLGILYLIELKRDNQFVTIMDIILVEISDDYSNQERDLIINNKLVYQDFGKTAITS